MPTMEQKHLAAVGFAMGHPRRVALFDLLHSRPEVGNTLAALEVASRLPRSTLIHHLRQMEKVGLVGRMAKGAATVYRINPTVLIVIAAELAARAKPAGRMNPRSPVRKAA